MPKSLRLIKFFKAIREPPLREGKETKIGACTSYLPTELWLEIIGHIADKHTLICLAQVNRALREVTEPTLYNAVTLQCQWDVTEITKFRDSIRSCPRRAGYVFKIALIFIDKEDDRLHDVLPSLLNSLQSLQHLHIEEIPGPGTACCTGLSTVRLPQLRTFVASMRTTSSALLDFLAAHKKLQEIDLRTTYIDDELSKSLKGTPLLSVLRTLTCRTPFLNSRPPIPPNLTHLYRPSFFLWHLPLLATHAGPQLVSLRPGNVFPLEHFQPWSLLDIVSKFPHLCFLHVDMPYTITPILDTRLVDWYQERPAWFHCNLNGRPRITLAWMYGENLYRRHEEFEPRWDRCLDDGALQVLREWGDCVERVVYEIGGRYTSTVLGTADGVERQLVKTEDKNMHEDYWKCV